MDRLSLLETLIVALDEGSLNRAAARREMTQSAVSQQIKQLEASSVISSCIALHKGCALRAMANWSTPMRKACSATMTG